MPTRSAQVVVCGAGMVGVATAYHLAERHRLGRVVVVDDREPLSEAGFWGDLGYHGAWAGSNDDLARFASRSIDLLEELSRASDRVFELNRRGLVRLTGEASKIPSLRAAGERLARWGHGPLRESSSPLPAPPSPSRPRGSTADLDGPPDGNDLVLGSEAVRRVFPFVTHDTQALLRMRRAGWLDGALLGGWMLERARAHGAELIRDRIEAVKVYRGRLEKVILHSGVAIATERLVIAAGSLLRPVVSSLGLDLPVLTEVQSSMLLRERLGIVPPETPMLVWDDPLYLRWSDREREQLATSAETRRLLEALPGGVLMRPYDTQRGGRLLVSWNYDPRVCDPRIEPTFDLLHAEILLRGLVRVVPGLFAYFGHGGEGQVEHGFSVRAPDDLPLIGPLSIAGTFVAGALGCSEGMGAPAAGELAACHVSGGELPEYATAFLPSRFEGSVSSLRRPAQTAGSRA